MPKSQGTKLLTPYTYWYTCPKCNQHSRKYPTEKAMFTWKRLHFKKCKGAKEMDKKLFNKGSYADYVYDGNVGNGAKMDLVCSDRFGFATESLNEIMKVKHSSKKEKKFKIKALKYPNINMKLTEKDLDKIDLDAIVKKAKTNKSRSNA